MTRDAMNLFYPSATAAWRVPSLAERIVEAWFFSMEIEAVRHNGAVDESEFVQIAIDLLAGLLPAQDDLTRELREALCATMFGIARKYLDSR